MSDTELAWAAGFFDGEGHIRFSERRYSLRMSVNQCDPRPLQRFTEAVGEGKVRPIAPHKAARPTHRPMWEWDLSGYEKVTLVYLLLRPFLSESKREQGDDCLARVKRARSVDHRREGALKREAKRRSEGYYERLRSAGWKGWKEPLPDKF
jgi:hypothetical protein